MMQLSLAGLLGAIVGTAIAAVNYTMVIGFVQKSLRAHDRSQTAGGARGLRGQARRLCVGSCSRSTFSSSAASAIGSAMLIGG